MLIVYPILRAPLHKYNILYTIFPTTVRPRITSYKKLHINFLDKQRNTNSFANYSTNKITLNKKVIGKILDKQKCKFQLFKKMQILLPTTVQTKITINKKVTGKILDKQK